MEKKFPKFLTAVILFTIIIIACSLFTMFYVNKKVETSFIYIIAFFILVSYFSLYLSKSRLDKHERREVLSFTISFIIFGLLLIPIYVFNYLDIKTITITGILFFCWLTTIKLYSKFLPDPKVYLKSN